MTDQQQKPMNRSMTPKTPGANPFKKGDIIWVVYRKSINWPAKVTAYYPKDRKVSYVFFPLVPKNNVFKTDPAKVQLFTLEDQLPENAPADLEECFEQARRILQGVPEEEIIADYAMKKQDETPVQTKPKKKSLTTADALKKTASGTPKSATATPKTHLKQARTVPKAASFSQGDPIIVDTPMGMWPGMFISFAKGNPHMVNYSLFPREEHSHEVMQTLASAIIPFPAEQVDQAIEDGRSTNSEVLLAALQDVQKYINEGGQPAAVTPSGGTTSTSAALSMSMGMGILPQQQQQTAAQHPSGSELLMKEKKPKKSTVKVELTPPRESTKQQPRKSLNSRLSSRGIDEDNMAATMPTLQKSKKRAASQMLQEAADDVPSVGPMLKRRKEIGMEEADDETAVMNTEGQGGTKSLMNGGPAGGSATGGKLRRLSATERNREIAKLGEKAEKMMREKQLKAAASDGEQQQQTSSSSSLPSSPTKEPMATIKTATEEADIPTVTVTDEDKKEELLAYNLALSAECRAHIETLTTNLGEDWLLKQQNTDDDFQIEFRKVGLFTSKELEDLVSIAQEWFDGIVYKDSGSSEHLSKLRELSLISKNLMPEISAFVISKKNDCSLEEARRIYAERCATGWSVSADPPEMSPKQQQTHKLHNNSNNSSNNNKSLSTLIEAAKMMEGSAASSAEEQQQNGVSVPSSPVEEGSRTTPLGTGTTLTIQADTDSAGDSE